MGTSRLHTLPADLSGALQGVCFIFKGREKRKAHKTTKPEKLQDQIRSRSPLLLVLLIALLCIALHQSTRSQQHPLVRHTTSHKSINLLLAGPTALPIALALLCTLRYWLHTGLSKPRFQGFDPSLFTYPRVPGLPASPSIPKLTFRPTLPSLPPALAPAPAPAPATSARCSGQVRPGLVPYLNCGWTTAYNTTQRTKNKDVRWRRSAFPSIPPSQNSLLAVHPPAVPPCPLNPPPFSCPLAGLV